MARLPPLVAHHQLNSTIEVPRYGGTDEKMIELELPRMFSNRHSYGSPHDPEINQIAEPGVAVPGCVREGGERREVP